jgi:hypothetical protein
MRNDKDNLIVSLTFKFALDIIRYCEILEIERKYVVARQLLKSGTSIGANIREAQNSESKQDFIHKFKIVLLFHYQIFKSSNHQIEYARQNRNCKTHSTGN